MEKLVRINKYSSKIKELGILARIETDHPIIIRDEVAKRLARVANSLPEGLSLQIDSGYRSIRTQKKLWKNRSKVIGGLVVNPQTKYSSHHTGGAVDVSLLDRNGKELNLSEPFKKYYLYPKLKSHEISQKAQYYRLLLNNSMIKAGFAPNPKEYWHFYYGDKVWADYYQKKVLYYDVKSVDKKLLYGFFKKYWFRMIKRGWWLLRRVFRVSTSY